MDKVLASSFPLSVQKIINEWRVYLRANTLADLTTSNGTKLTKDVFYGWQSTERTSTLKWPVASRPHRDLLHHWQSFLRIEYVAHRARPSSYAIS
mmetsp:Transcript_19545/g.27872  ORF Transcript_19545/g.27872 Transcript_19545/m.27872 type:complete len:95 (+) Transcript_19545:1104-1388(+)